MYKVKIPKGLGKNLISRLRKKMVLHVWHALMNKSVPSSAKQQRETTTFYRFENNFTTWTHNSKSFILYIYFSGASTSLYSLPLSSLLIKLPIDGKGIPCDSYSRRYASDLVQSWTMATARKTSRAARLFLLIQPIISLFYGVIVVVAVFLVKAPLRW